MSSADPDNGWKFAQCFGDKGEVEDVTEADIISAVEFDSTGDYLATGDRGGRVVLFERNEGVRRRLTNRRNLANTNSLLNSNHTNLNLTT